MAESAGSHHREPGGGDVVRCDAGRRQAAKAPDIDHGIPRRVGAIPPMGNAGMPDAFALRKVEIGDQVSAAVPADHEQILPVAASQRVLPAPPEQQRKRLSGEQPCAF